MNVEDAYLDLPSSLVDTKKNTTYQRSRFLGKGGFGRCYEIINAHTNSISACKIVSKKLTYKSNQESRIYQEVEIHGSLEHPNIVKMNGFFEDEKFIYIVLELCCNYSMSEMLERRKMITEFECLYYMKQIITGVMYLHEHKIVHRDLKCGNILLNGNLHVKIGDFGLSARIETIGGRRMSVCGTPNYIAPEVILKTGHSFEVDIWAIGCIMFTLLVGRSPFQSIDVNTIYARIKNCDYIIPAFLSRPAINMIAATLRRDPRARPSAADLLKFAFITNNEMNLPPSLPASCLSMEPRLQVRNKRRVLAEVDVNAQQNNDKPEQAEPVAMEPEPESEPEPTDQPDVILTSIPFIVPSVSGATSNDDRRFRDIEALFNDLTALFNAKPKELEENPKAENADPNAQPLYWVSKWVDYTHKYGFAYQLSDESIGIMFNDSTKIVLLGNRFDVHYIDVDGKECYMTLTSYNSSLANKIKLLTLFERYMYEHLVKAGRRNVRRRRDEISRMPFMDSWFRTESAIVFHLTNGTIQFNFTNHVKIILCPLMKSVTYVESPKRFNTYKFETIGRHGYSKNLCAKLSHIRIKLGELCNKL